MKLITSSFRLAGYLSGILLAFNVTGAADDAPRLPHVQLVRTPDHGLQPQVVRDGAGVTHLVYYKGDPKAGDLFYVRQQPGSASFSAPIRVNSQKGSAMAMGTIRGAQLTLGRQGHIYVIWNGGEGAAAVKHRGAPLLYTRLNDTGTAFEPERDMISTAVGLDGGSSVAADQSGHVYVTWHALLPGQTEGEEHRAVFVARSADDGRTFTPERPALNPGTGVCACCGMRALVDAQGTLYLLYRAATAMTNRDEVLLASRDQAEHFQVLGQHHWISATCPMSSASLSQGKGRVLAAWETDGQVDFSAVNDQTGRVSKPVSAPGQAARKHPVVVQNAQGQVLLVWTEGTGWERGGSVAWQIFDPTGQPLLEPGRADGVPVWSLAAAFAQEDGNFVVVY